MIFPVKQRLTHIAPFKLGLALAVSFAALGLVLGLVIFVTNWIAGPDAVKLAEAGWPGAPQPPAAVLGATPNPPTSPKPPVGEPAAVPSVDFAGGTVVHFTPVRTYSWDYSYNAVPLDVSPAWTILILAVVYPLVGFVSGVLGAGAFNLTAEWTGGIEFNVEDIG